MNQNEPPINTFLKRIEESYFIGRQAELNHFQAWIDEYDPSFKVLHHHGIGGVGKTFLLQAYKRLAEEKGILYLQLDSQEFIHTPSDFAEYVLQMIEFTVHPLPFQIESYSIESCIDLLEQLAATERMILSIDTYELMDDLDRWFRQILMKKLPKNILVILAGRKPLRNEWNHSAPLRRITKQMELKEFTLDQARTYLNQFQIQAESLILAIWQLTEGHPLTLSMATLANSDQSIERVAENTPNILLELTGRWLNEVQNEELHQLIDIAALFHQFDRQSLSTVLEKEVSLEKFNELISLSFIRARNSGWSMHDLIRDAIQLEMKHRNPEIFNNLSEKIANYYYHRTIKTRSPYDIAQFFYHLRNDFIQTAFFQEMNDQLMYLEPVEAYNFHEVQEFFAYKKENLSESDVNFFNRTSSRSYQFYASLQHNQREAEFLGPDYVQKMGYETTSLLKNKDGEAIGISIIVPINETTLKHLANEPVSRAYFDHLSKEEMEAFRVPETENAGWYIRHLDFVDPTDSSAQSYLLYNLFTLTLPGGKIITSTPVQFFQELLAFLGFQEIPNAISYDFGEDIPSPTYILDVSGQKLDQYLKQFTQSNAYQSKLEMIAETLSLTEREKDIIQLILENKNNKEIATSLFIAEITVKKHVSRILKKANVKNRRQLIKQFMEFV
ncbi:regulatory protein, luxR family [Oceanobacillus limi]|uniref:Regulatory protein, luxR family n=1 Tax=Oceanobacillus limi TaxID=930131 RepID=A0A1I0FLM5_9BACI|nr:LuxR family transcriptional regulator [Oceanobacillus limi]SET59210.1 regulatory protein, luxR family [Oceanobacillus limi]